MSKFNEVTAKFKNIPYMDEKRAEFIRELVTKHELRNILEIGFFHGKSSAYLAAILEDIGEGHVTTLDFDSAKLRQPNIHELLDDLGLSKRVTPIFVKRSYTWELGKMIRSGQHGAFDFCYFDGGHTWDATGFGFYLVDILLRPGGWIIFDDLDWTIHYSIQKIPDRKATYAKYSDDEKMTPGVRLVFETIVPHLGYGSLSEHHQFKWGIAQKAHAQL